MREIHYKVCDVEVLGDERDACYTVIEASARHAAEVYVRRRTHHDVEFHEQMTVNVTDPAGVVTRWVVSGRLDPVYTAIPAHDPCGGVVR